jgi:sulfite reductase (NADPH) hemoprotein beta-component
MHANQTSGNCIRNITADPFAGVAPDEVADPRPFARSCGSGRPSTRSSPSCRASSRSRSTAAAEDRAVLRVHDIGLDLVRNDDGELGFRRCSSAAVSAARRSSAKRSRAFLPWQHLISYCEAILRVYNRWGRRDNLYKARIKILVKALGRGVPPPGRSRMGARSRTARHHHRAEFTRVAGALRPPAYDTLPRSRCRPRGALLATNKAFATWVKRNVRTHRQRRLRRGDPVAEEDRHRAGRHQRRADGPDRRLADRFSFGELRACCTSRT